jgi:hypothetical protein
MEESIISLWDISKMIDLQIIRSPPEYSLISIGLKKSIFEFADLLFLKEAQGMS